MARPRVKAKKPAAPAAKPEPAKREVKGVRCYLVTCGPRTRIAATAALARAAKAELAEETGRKKSDAEVEDHEIPRGKPGLIEYLNETRAAYEQRLLDAQAPKG